MCIVQVPQEQHAGQGLCLQLLRARHLDVQHLQAGRHGEVRRGQLHPALRQWRGGGHPHPVDL